MNRNLERAEETCIITETGIEILLSHSKVKKNLTMMVVDGEAIPLTHSDLCAILRSLRAAYGVIAVLLCLYLVASCSVAPHYLIPTDARSQYAKKSCDRQHEACTGGAPLLTDIWGTCQRQWEVCYATITETPK